MSDSLYSDSPHTDFSHVYYILSIFNPRVLFPLPRPLSSAMSIIALLSGLSLSASHSHAKQFGQSVSRPKFKQNTSRIRTWSVNVCGNLFGSSSFSSSSFSSDHGHRTEVFYRYNTTACTNIRIRFVVVVVVVIYTIFRQTTALAVTCSGYNAIVRISPFRHLLSLAYGIKRGLRPPTRALVLLRYKLSGFIVLCFMLLSSV